MYRRITVHPHIAIFGRKPHIPTIRYLADNKVPMVGFNGDLLKSPSHEINRLRRLQLKMVSKPVLVAPYISNYVQRQLTRDFGFLHLLTYDDKNDEIIFTSKLEYNALITNGLTTKFKIIANNDLLDYIKKWDNDNRL